MYPVLPLALKSSTGRLRATLTSDRRKKKKVLRVSSYAGCSGEDFVHVGNYGRDPLFIQIKIHATFVLFLGSRIKEGMQLLDLFESG